MNREEDESMRQSAREVQYEKNKHLIDIYASNYSKRFGLDVSDLVSVGEEAFVRALSSYKRGRGSFRSWFRSILRNRILDYASVTDSPVEDETLEFRLKTTATDPYKIVAFKDALGMLSSEAKYIVNILLTSPCEVLEITGAEMPKMIRGAIKRHCREEGWRWEWIWSAFKEIKEFLQILQS